MVVQNDFASKVVNRNLERNSSMNKIDPRAIISPMHALFCSWLEELEDDNSKDKQMPKRKNPDHHAVIAKYAETEKVSDRPQKQIARPESRTTENIEKNNGGNA